MQPGRTYSNTPPGISGEQAVHGGVQERSQKGKDLFFLISFVHFYLIQFYF